MRIEPRVVTTSDYVPSAPFLPRVVGGQSFLGMSDDYAFWRAAANLYDEDKVQAAFDVASDLGIGSIGEKLGMVRLLEAESDVRERGQIVQISDWLRVEFIAGELQERVQELARLAMTRAEAERRRFALKGSDPVLLTLLSQDKDAPWAAYRYGYCAQKTQYYKICIPHHATLQDARFDDVFGHEYAHVISLSESKNRLTKWLGEGFSVFVAGEYSDQAKRTFAERPRAWLTPADLELQFGPGLDLGSSNKWLAYQQAGFITLHLASLGGEDKLMELLEDIGSESFWTNLKVSALGVTRTSNSIGRVYRLNEATLFRDAMTALKA